MLIWLTVLLSHGLTVTALPCLTAMLLHCFTVSPSSLLRCLSVPAALSHCLTVGGSGSNIAYAVADTPAGPFKAAEIKPTPGGKRNPLQQFSTNPHIAYSAADKKWLLYYNGRQWAANDLTSCEPNKTGLPYWHGGGACTTSKDCPGFGAGTDHQQNPGSCVEGYSP